MLIKDIFTTFNLSNITAYEINGTNVPLVHMQVYYNLVVSHVSIRVHNKELKTDDLFFTVFSNTNEEIHADVEIPQGATYIELVLEIKTIGGNHE